METEGSGEGTGHDHAIHQLQEELAGLIGTMDELNLALAELLKAVRQHSVKLMLALEAVAPQENTNFALN